MPKQSLVSVTIPTKNSANTIEYCLAAVEEQDYPNLEIIVIDSHSSDRTLRIVDSHRVKVVETDWKLLGARYLGVIEARGEYVVLVDSDQFLEKGCISRAVNQALQGEFDMLCLEESSFSRGTVIERLFDADRKLVNKFHNENIDPKTGTLLPRFFKRDLLLNAFSRIPESLLPVVVAHDHAIIYYEASQISNKVGILRRAVKHKEPSNLFELCIKNYNYGSNTKDLIKSGFYTDLVKNKTRFRINMTADFKLGTQSFLLLLLKGLAYEAGYILRW